MPRGPRKLAIKFGTATLTHYGGVYLVNRFVSRIGFRDASAREIRLALPASGPREAAWKCALDHINRLRP